MEKNRTSYKPGQKSQLNRYKQLQGFWQEKLPIQAHRCHSELFCLCRWWS